MVVTEPQWLTREEQRTWRTFLIATRLLFAALERDLQQGAGIPLTYYEVLSVLSDAPNRTLRMSALANALQVSPSRISHAVARLEESGWVRRELCPADRRSWFAVLTENGLATVEAIAPIHVASVRRHLFDELTAAQLDDLHTISDSLLHHLAPDGPPLAIPLPTDCGKPEGGHIT